MGAAYDKSTWMVQYKDQAAKTGALGSVQIVEALAERVAKLSFPLVVDPVMISKHGAKLMDEPAAAALAKRLLPCAFLVTPNLPEASALSGRTVENLAAMEDAARAIGGTQSPGSQPRRCCTSCSTGSSAPGRFA